VDKYLRGFLSKGVPSTFVSLKSLYTNPSKRKTIQDLAESYLASLREDNTFPTHTSTSTQPNGTGKLEPPTTLLWTLYFLALHYAHPQSARDISRSLALIEQAIEHTPTLVELHLTKARLLKYTGDKNAAVDAIMVARDLDLQDRFVNTKVGKYLLRADRNEEALVILKEFTRPDSPGGGPLADLTDMQCMWFALEDGESYARQGKYGVALKRFHTIWKHFEEWEEDQFDFHSYSFRKGPIRDYIKLLTWEDKLRSHPYFIRCAHAATTIYINLHDNPALANSQPSPSPTDADRKKAVKKAKKAAKKAEESTPPNPTDKALKKDDDPLGEKLVKTTTPLDDATKFLRPLQALSSTVLETQLVAFDVHFRRGKLFQAVAALNAANRIAKGERRVVERVGMLKGKVAEVDLTSELKEIMEGALRELEVVQNGI